MEYQLPEIAICATWTIEDDIRSGNTDAALIKVAAIRDVVQRAFDMLIEIPQAAHVARHLDEVL